MSSCGKEYCPDSKCGRLHPFNGGKRARCERIKGCQAKVCAPLAAAGPAGFTLYDACLGACNQNEDSPTYPGRFSGYEEYLCKMYPGEELWEYYGINPCNVDPSQTEAGQKEKTRQEIADKNSLFLWVLLGALLITMFLFFRKK